MFQVDCMVSGIVPHVSPIAAATAVSAPSSFLVLAYSVADDTMSEEVTENKSAQRRRAAHPPELRLISRAGEELSSDLLQVSNFAKYGCNDYSLVDANSPGGRCYVVLSPTDVVIVRPRDQRDHVDWLVGLKRYEEALVEVQKLGGEGAAEIGEQYVAHLIHEGQYEKAAKMCPEVYAHNAHKWETLVFLFVEHKQLHVRRFGIFVDLVLTFI